MLRGALLRRRLAFILALCSLSTAAYICLLAAQPRLHLSSGSLNDLLEVGGRYSGAQAGRQQARAGGSPEDVRQPHSPLTASSVNDNESFASAGALHGETALSLVGREKIICDINGGQQRVACVRDGSEVYVPFSFLRKYFEVYGKLSQDSANGNGIFYWQHAYSKYATPMEKYRVNGPYLWFGNYNVAVRDRVKVISGIDGVPVSTQWNSSGHLYPTQIAQFGLSHFSKNLTNAAGRRFALVLEGLPQAGVECFSASGIDRSTAKSGSTTASRIDEHTGRRVLPFSTHGVRLQFEAAAEFAIVQLDVAFGRNGSALVYVETPTGVTYSVHYVTSDVLISSRGRQVFIGVGLAARGVWRTLTRDVAVDLRKGLSLHVMPLSGRRAAKTAAALVGRGVQVVAIELRGSGRLANATLLTHAHHEYFYAACDYLLRQQDSNGGWPISVGRTLVAPDVLVLSPPWYSAMAQGQAMSLLVRAYLVTRQRDYLQAALRALTLFERPQREGGVLARFADRFSWYEEYPTARGSFVLNGFVYALFGLYDVFKVTNDSRARTLFVDGVASLKRLLPLFDTGSGSVYDLRHFSIPSLAPNIARWDYHTTHISQLLHLNTIVQSNVLEATAQRWIDYLHGRRAPHN